MYLKQTRDFLTMATTSMIHVRLDEHLKNDAVAALEAMGLSLSDAIRVFLTRIATEKKFPFVLSVPNIETTQAMEEARTITKARFNNQQDLFNTLNHE
jgi:DNA-damage-inducible protein J